MLLSCLVTWVLQYTKNLSFLKGWEIHLYFFLAYVIKDMFISQLFICLISSLLAFFFVGGSWQVYLFIYSNFNLFISD